MISDKCKEEVSHPKVKIKDKAVSVVLLNPGRKKLVKIRVDGCVIKNAKAADWLVAKMSRRNLIVELKGKDVEHAAAQIHATATHFVGKRLLSGEWAALIVSSQYPRASTMIQRRQQEFQKRFSGRLHVASQNREFDFDALF